MSEPKVKIEVTTKIDFSDKAKSRLLRLAKLLRADAKRKNGLKFDMGTFLSTPSADKDKLIEPGLNCGTRACAFGLAALSGEFKRDGLSYKILQAPDYGFAPNGAYHNRIEFRYKGNNYDGDDMVVASKLFDIPETVATWLFGGQASKKTNGAAAEVEMAEIIDGVCKGKLPENVVEDLIYIYAD